MTVQNAAAAPILGFEQFFGLAEEGTVALPRCLDCDRCHWYPMERCPHCFSERLVWSRVPAGARVYSATTVRFAFTSATTGATPYGLALVELDAAAGIRLMCRTTCSDVAVGDRVEVRVEAGPDESSTGMVWCTHDEDDCVERSRPDRR